MRFHCGISFRPKLSWLKWIGIGVVGLLAFFGIGNHVVLAAEAGTYNYSPSSVSVYNNNGSTTHNLTWSSTNSTALGGNGAYARFSSATCGGGLDCPPIYSGEVTYSYAAHKFCSSSDKVTLTTRFYLRNNNNDSPPNLGFNITGTQASINSKTYDSSNMVYVVNFTIADNSSFQLNYNFNDTNNSYYFYSSSTRISWSYNCDYTLEQSTSDIINNSNNNTQQIIDSQSQINDNLTDDTIDGALDTGNDFFDNFETNSTSGFAGIITAPVRVFQEMINNNACTPLRLSLVLNDGLHSGSNDLSVPCGNILWDKAPEAVVGIWQTLIAGVLVYRVLADLVKFVNGLLNPDDTKEFIMDL